MREMELTEIGRELAKYFNARPSDDTWDGFGLEYAVRDVREHARAAITATNVRYIADYVAATEEVGTTPPSVA